MRSGISGLNKPFLMKKACKIPISAIPQALLLLVDY